MGTTILHRHRSDGLEVWLQSGCSLADRIASRGGAGRGNWTVSVGLAGGLGGAQSESRSGPPCRRDALLRHRLILLRSKVASLLLSPSCPGMEMLT